MRRLAAILVIGAFGAATFVIPADGLPSLRSVNKTAKRALKTAKKGPKVIEREQKDVPAAPGDFAEFDIRCPRGYVAVGIGMGLGALEPVFFASYGSGALGSMFNPSSTSVFDGTMYVECVKSSGYASSSRVFRSKAEAQQALRDAEAAKTAAGAG